MRNSRFTDEQIIAILSEQERGVATVEVCRKHGISEGVFYKRKAKFGGMSPRTENARPKRLLADEMLDNVTLKDILGEN